MGMFDDIKCHYPLPVPGANALDYQTKDTDSQYLDQYEIRQDGTLWHQNYDIEDHSDLAKWKAANPGQEPPEELNGLLGMCGCMSRVNKRWEQVNWTGEIQFYTMYGIAGDGALENATSRDGWLQWSAYFVDGKLNQMNLIENRSPTPVEPRSE